MKPYTTSAKMFIGNKLWKTPGSFDTGSFSWYTLLPMRNIPGWLITSGVWLNTKVLNGKPGQSMCARHYENKLAGKWYGIVLAKITDILFWFDANHCKKSWLLYRFRHSVVLQSSGH